MKTVLLALAILAGVTTVAVPSADAGFCVTTCTRLGDCVTSCN
jgi:hypothetical protein